MGAASSVDDGRGDPFVTVEEMKGVPDVAWRDFIENFDGLDAAAKLPREVVMSQAMAWKEDTQLGAALTSAKASVRCSIVGDCAVAAPLYRAATMSHGLTIITYHPACSRR